MKDLWVLMSAVQKCIRRGMEWEACYFAFQLEEINPTLLWQRLRIMVSEDIGANNPSVIPQINILHNWYVDSMSKGKYGGRLHLINAILILSRSMKCRDADNIMNSLDNMMYKEGYEIPVPDFVYDKHTRIGKMKKRGYDHFFEEGAKCRDDTSNLEYKRRALEMLKKYGSAKDIKMERLKRKAGLTTSKPKGSVTLEQFGISL